MSEHKYAVFILTHGRPNKVKTVPALEKYGYTGDVYLVCDNLDPTLSEYQSIYGDQVIVFDKLEAQKITDSGDNFESKAAVVFARNAVKQIAKDLGLDYYIVLDDDYVQFRYMLDKNHDPCKKLHCIWNMDRVCDIMVEYLHNTPRMTSFAMAQTGEMMGGARRDNTGPIRKVMNFFVFSTERDYEFMGKINEDVNLYVSHGFKGGLHLTTRRICLQQSQTQLNAGGLTDIYLELGTYIKSFYSVMYQPSCVSIKPMGISHRRLHHSIDWRHTVPKILNPKYSRISDHKTESDTWEKDPES